MPPAREASVGEWPDHSWYVSPAPSGRMPALSMTESEFFMSNNGFRLKKEPKTNRDYNYYYLAKVSIPIPEVQKLCEERWQKDYERQREQFRNSQELTEVRRQQRRMLELL